MLELRTFGGLSITDGGVACAGAATQRKTLALLALLAIAKNGVSRDKLIAYLWPDSDATHGRSLLKQACYALRRDLDQHDLLLGATELKLNPAVVASDIQTFEDALAHGDAARAVAVYAGPFLDGFFLSGAEEFERWVETERARCAREVGAALEALASAAAADGDHRVAAEWWRRLTTLDPFSTHAAVGLLQALDDAGERAAAVQYGRAYEALVRDELGAEPASEVVALTKRLHRQTGDGLRRVPLTASRPSATRAERRP